MVYYKSSSELYHHGILGMKWGVRRYQNKDGTLTEAGQKRYSGDKVRQKIKTDELRNYYARKRIEKVGSAKAIRDEDRKASRKAGFRVGQLLGGAGFTATYLPTQVMLTSLGLVNPAVPVALGAGFVLNTINATSGLIKNSHRNKKNVDAISMQSKEIERELIEKYGKIPVSEFDNKK